MAVAALAEPVVPVRRTWVGLLFAANLGLFTASFTPVQILLPLQIAALGISGKEAALGLVTGLAAVCSILASPLAGMLSDRTRPRLFGRTFGRRHVWTLGGCLTAALALAWLGQAPDLVTVAVGWCVAQVGLNAMQASLSAAVPDRVPVAQRGFVSGWVGMPQALGLVIGAVLVTAVFAGVPTGYTVLAVVLVALGVPFALATPDDPIERTQVVRATWRISLREHPDFAWAWGTRFLVLLGNALGTLYLLYFLTDRVKLADPETGLLILIMLYTVGMVLTAVFFGRMSDRTGRRKIFVIWSGVVMAVAALILALRPTWPAAIVAALVLGLGFGIYLAVDTALITQVLPAANDRAKDLGVINIASSAPQVLGPAISAPLVTHLGGYPTLFGVTAAVMLLGSVLVTRIRSVP
ncbi:MFS transporter [Actinoplanes sp. NPDC051470]|uniref:MFS transporter n=1 Tax=Actinoplanes sp. NPDC051470 TaxID=3157224 RepID=UPI0034452FC7